MSTVTPQLDDEQFDRMPALARVLYITFLQLYSATGGEAEVFVEFEKNGQGEIQLRPSNVHGYIRFVFDEHHHLVDAEWVGVLPVENELIEALADLEHDRWSGWEKYRATRSTSDTRLESEARWKRQRETPYAELSEKEKESDRVEARKTIALLRKLKIYGNSP